MEPNQYKYMFEVEDSHWWYVGNHENYMNLLGRRKALRNGIRMLDAGCGTGRWLEIVKSSFDILETGIDYQQTALDYAKTRGKLNLHLADINTCNFETASFDLISSFDVICNINIDDALAIKNFSSWLAADGYLLLNLPAYQFLLSKHDKMVHQNKRYTRRQIKSLLEQNGFTIIRSSYCVCLLFPFAMIKRMLDKISLAKDTEHNEVKLPGRFINRLFLMVMRMENFVLRFISLPFGLSVMVLAKKKE